MRNRMNQPRWSTANMTILLTETLLGYFHIATFSVNESLFSGAQFCSYCCHSCNRVTLCAGHHWLPICWWQHHNWLTPVVASTSIFVLPPLWVGAELLPQSSPLPLSYYTDCCHNVILGVSWIWWCEGLEGLDNRSRKDLEKHCGWGSWRLRDSSRLWIYQGTEEPELEEPRAKVV